LGKQSAYGAWVGCPRSGIGGNGRNGIGGRRLAVGVLVAIGEREAAERRAGDLLQTMVDREQLSLRPAVAVARRHDQPAQRQPTSRTRAARPEWMWLV
jgi:hypothetical protein